MGNPRRTQPTEVATSLRRVSSQHVPILAEVVAIPVGGVGAVVNFSFLSGPLTNAAGSDIGGAGDSSLVLTSTAFTTEVAATDDVNLTNGQFWIDYLTGEARGKKADTSTSATAAYGTFVMLVKSFSAASVKSNGGTGTAVATTGGTQIVPANSNRNYTQCQNNGSVNVYFGNATVDNTYPVVVPGGVFRWDSQEALVVLAASSTATIAFIDYLNA